MKYTQSHEWIRVEGTIGVIGITHYAQKELGEIVYVELPKLGRHLTAGEEAAVLESTKAAADVYTPVSGTISTINETLKTNSGLVNQSPEDKGWLFKIQIDNIEELEELLDEEEYQAILSKRTTWTS